MNDWTIATLKEHVKEILDLREKWWLDKFRGIESSTAVAKAAADQAAIVLAEVRKIRDEGQNEWRKTVDDMKTGYTPLGSHEDLLKRVAALERGSGSEEGRRKGTTSAVGYLYAAVGVAIGVGGLLIALLT